jgi:AraC-like DNA-binding protein
MTETTGLLPETPPASGDVLSDLLGTMHLAGTVLFRAEFREPWSVVTPDSVQLAQVLPFRTEHIIPFHVIASGGCWLEIPGHDRVWLGEGDAVLLPYGDSHRLSGRANADPVQVGHLLPPPPWHDILVVEHGGAGPRMSIVCGFLQCDELLFHPILRHLPVLLHVGPDAGVGDNWLAATIRHTATEASRLLPGSRNMLPRLTELMFVEILRKHMQDLSADEVGWFAAFNDPVAGRALKYLHTSPFQDWSVDRLARQVGVSRTVLADRFKHFLDQPPMQYLARWRLQLAAQHLKASDLPIKTIADQAGYESEPAFNRAFKRHFGLPPGDWRRRQGSHRVGKTAGELDAKEDRFPPAR